MAKQKYTLREYLISFGLAGGLLLIAWVMSKAIWNIFEVFATKNPTLAAPIIAGTFTLLGGVSVVMIGRHFERKKEMEIAHRQRQTEVFDRLIKAVIEVILAKGNEDASASLTTTLRDLTPGLIL